MIRVIIHQKFAIFAVSVPVCQFCPGDDGEHLREGTELVRSFGVESHGVVGGVLDRCASGGFGSPDIGNADVGADTRNGEHRVEIVRAIMIGVVACRFLGLVTACDDLSLVYRSEIIVHDHLGAGDIIENDLEGSPLVVEVCSVIVAPVTFLLWDGVRFEPRGVGSDPCLQAHIYVLCPRGRVALAEHENPTCDLGETLEVEKAGMVAFCHAGTTMHLRKRRVGTNRQSRQ